MDTRGVILINRLAHPSARMRTVLGLIFLELMMLGMGYVLYRDPLHLSLQAKAKHDIVDQIQYDVLVISLPFMVLAAVPAYFSILRQKIVIDARGVKYDNGGGLFGWLFGKPWSVRWNEIDETRWVMEPQRPVLARLILKTRQGRRNLVPWNWVEGGRPLVKQPFSISAMPTDKVRTLLTNTPLVKGLAAIRPDLHITDFDRNGNVNPMKLVGVTPTTAFIAVTMVIAMFYFITEYYFTLSEFYIRGTPWPILIGAGVISGLVMYGVLVHKEPQRKDSMLYALFFALSIGFTAYPLSIRANMWTAPGGLTTAGYRLGTDYVWHPDNSALPALDIYRKTNFWWQQFHPGDQHEFRVRHGGLGGWLVNMDDISQDQRAYYRAHGPGTP